jgi:hypothetical protein
MLLYSMRVRFRALRTMIRTIDHVPLALNPSAARFVSTSTYYWLSHDRQIPALGHLSVYRFNVNQLMPLSTTVGLSS